MSLSLPFVLPAPSVSGHTATYAEVLSGVDVVVNTDEQGGVAHTLVVKNRVAAANPALARLRLTASSRDLSASIDSEGRLRFTDRSGRVAYSSPAAIMWDSAPAPVGAKAARPGSVDRRLVEATGGALIDAATGAAMNSTARTPGEAARVAAVAVSTSPAGVDLVPDQGLLSDPTTVYPVMIDPTLQPNIWSAYNGDWTEVESGKPTTALWNQSGPAQIGNCVWPGPPPKCNGIGVTRSFFQWNIAGFYNTTILAAQVNFTALYAVDCNSIVKVDWVDPVGPGTNWNNQPHSSGTPGSGGTCSGGIGADVTDQLRYAANNHTNTLTFRLKAADEGDTGAGWKKFTQNNAVLSVSYDVVPVTPWRTQTSPATVCTTTTPYPVIGRTDVSLFAATSLAADGVAKPLEAQFVVTNLATGATINRTTQTTAGSWTLAPIAQGAFADGDYSWTVRVFDGLLYSGWTPACRFHVDTSQPGTPTITSTDFPGDGLTGRPVRTPGTVTFSPPVGSSTPVGYRYQINGGIPVIVNASNGSWTGTVTPSRIGPNFLTVQALSAAGTPSPAAQRILLATPPATPDRDGDLTGDGKPDLLTVGGTNGTAPGLWLTPGTGTGTLGAPTNIGIRGTALSTTLGTPTDWAGTLVTTGQFTGSGMQDILAVSPNGTVRVYANPGDGSALTLDTGTITTLFGDSFLDPNWEPLLGPTTAITQIVSVGHLPEDSLPSSDSRYPDLIATVNNGGHHELWWFEHGLGAGNFGTAAVVLDDTVDWSTKTIAAATKGGRPALLVRDNPTGQVDLYATTCTVDCYNLNWFTDATRTVARPASSVLTKTNAPSILGNDTNNDTHPDLWAVGPTGAASYATGTTSGTLNTPAAAGTVIPPVSANLIPMGAVNWTNPATGQPQTDLFAATPTGQLLNYQRLPSGILGPPTVIDGGGWQHLTIFGIADFNHDGYPDIIARNNQTGLELIYRFTATGVTPAVVFSDGWQGFTPYGVADWNHDGSYDVVAADPNGLLFLYPGDLSTGLNNRQQIGSGWTSAYTPWGLLDFTSDNNPDILTNYSPTNILKMYSTNNQSQWTNDNGYTVGGPFNGWTPFALTNYNADPTHPNLIARHPTTGTLHMFTGNGQGGWSDPNGTIIANGW
ncbi:MAG TPA: hypothetical protein VFV67_28945 [Actinophytocola sp.]|uniref:hypothetical protein n=1 Tax=Actinophytocola sp. TaxID=1872138 RepID=UPI002DBAC9BA|nr:hypothetical protein [Actinophytocola sp.]HEU5474695.1 hypothetical protein [Actinophytocola sp.]